MHFWYRRTAKTFWFGNTTIKFQSIKKDIERSDVIIIFTFYKLISKKIFEEIMKCKKVTLLRPLDIELATGGCHFNGECQNFTESCNRCPKLNFLPLYFDASNPSSNLGWYQKERKGFLERNDFDGMLSLAFEHHLTIAKNIPLDQVIKWLVSTAPRGLIEFVPKTDETIKNMIILKGDIFPDYNEENFRKILENKSTIISETKISESGRKIFEYSKI